MQGGDGSGDDTRDDILDDTVDERFERVTVPDDNEARSDGTDDPVAPPPPPPPPPAPATDERSDEPALPRAPAKASPAVIASDARPTRGAETWYRTDQDRYRSVHRLANPWYRRLARGLIAMTFIATAGVGLYFGARLVQDYLDRDKLPSSGVDVPDIRATSFEIRSTSPAPVLDGTLTIDAETGAFEFTGRGTGTQSGVQVVSPDGSTTYVRRGSGQWSVAPSDQVALDVDRAVSYLRDDDSADDILTSQLRRGYVDLIDRTEVGEGDDEIRRYEMRLDTAGFDDDFPLQYREFQDRAIPGVQAVRGLLVTITLDADDVLVGVDDTGSNWSWQRLSYTDEPFQPLDPADQLLDGTIEVSDGNL